MTFVLTYHDIASAQERELRGFPGPTAARYKLDPERFERHLDAIAGTGVSVGLVGAKPHAALTFDDGGASAMLAADALERRGWRGHFFVTTARVGTSGFLSAEQVRELAGRGHDVGSHSHSHPTYMGALSSGELAAEWAASRDALREITGASPRSAAVPGGFLSTDVIGEAARAGYDLLMTSEPSARVRRHDRMDTIGRFTIWAATSPERAAAYARGDRRARAAMWLAWQAKTLSKQVNPEVYEGLRQRWARLNPRDRRA